jgi:hypothetical protein
MFYDVVKLLLLNVRYNRWIQKPTRQLQILQEDTNIWLIILAIIHIFFLLILDLYFITNL